MSEKFSTEVKQRAVSEVVLGLASMTKVAARYEMSVAYLSILCSRFRHLCGSDPYREEVKIGKKCHQSGSKTILPLVARIERLERNVREIFNIINN